MKRVRQYWIDVRLWCAAAAMLALAGCDQGEAETGATLDAVSDYEAGRTVLYDAKTRYEYPEAIDYLGKAVAADPTNAPAKLDLTYAYLKSGNYKGAEQTASVLNAGSSALPTTQQLWLTALTAKINDQSDAEIAAWKAVVAAAPEDRWAWYELASAQSGSGRYAASAVSAEQALAVEPNPKKWEASWIYYLQSKGLYRSGQYAAAIPAAEKGRGNETTWRSTFFRLALAELKSGQAADANSYVEEYIRISNAEGRNSETYTNANIALFYHELGDLENAERYATLAYSQDPKGYQSWALGFILADNGKPEQALEVLNPAAERFETDAYVHAAKGWAHYRLNQLEAAKAAFDTGLSVLKRRNHAIEGLAATVDAAIANLDAERAPVIPWLG